jgi:lysophospholipase L1-like esterase
MFRFFSFSALLVSSTLLATTTLASDSEGKLIPASNRHFAYDGRFDDHDPNHVVVIWQSSRISTDFKSAHLTLDFGPSVDECYFDADVDGVRELVAVKPNQAHQSYVWPHALEGGLLHHLTLAKRNEASTGYVTFDGVTLDSTGKVSTPVAHRYRLKMIFFGDSITAGACNEDGPTDQWTDHRTHNGNKSYAAFAARALDADWENISVSGMGIDIGYVPFVASQIWDRVYPKADSPRADLSHFKPDIVFVNYGENDTSFTHGHGMPFPPTFTKDYVSFIEGLRKAFPKAEIVLLRGGMTGGAQDANLRAAWTAAVEQLEKQDPRVTHFVFKHFSVQHPRVTDDQAMADELVAWLKEQKFVTLRY